MRSSGSRRLDTLDEAQQRLLVAVCIISGLTTVVPATYNYVLDPMLAGLHASQSQSSTLRQLPSIAALLVIFIAGAIGNRVGERRVITVAGSLFVLGCAVVTIAPVLPVAVVGLVVESAGATVIAVVALGLLGARITDPKGRGAAFSFFGAIVPIIYMGAPVAAGALIGATNWRVVPLVWTIGGVALVLTTRTMLPTDDASGQVGDLRVPVLAGVFLAVVVQGVGSGAHNGWTATATVIYFAAAAVTLGLVVAVHRRSTTSPLSFLPLRHGGALLLMVVVALVPFTAMLWFYATIGFQYVFGLSTTATALVLAPAQAAGVVGAFVAKRLLARRGVTFTGVAGLLALATSLLLCRIVSTSTPTWLSVVLISLFAVAATWAGIPVTNAIMDTAPAGHEGSASAFRSAATNVGRAIGVVVIAAVVYGSVQSSLATQFEQQGLNVQQSNEIAEQMRNGSSSESVASDYAVPVEQVETIAAAQRNAMLDGLHAQSTAGAAFAGLSAVVFVIARRRQAAFSARRTSGASV